MVLCTKHLFYTPIKRNSFRMALACTLPTILYGTRSSLFIVGHTTWATRAPTVKVFSGILLVLGFADLALTAPTRHHIYTHILMFKHFSQLITE